MEPIVAKNSVRTVVQSFSFCLILMLFAGLTSDAYGAEDSFSFRCDSKGGGGSVPDGIVAKVQDAYTKVSGMSAEFSQTSALVGFPDKVSSAGSLLFQKPGKMRWEYKTPDEQLFVSDGNSVWFYEPKMEQVTIAPLRATFRSDIPVSFLLGLGTLSESFELAESCVVGSRILLVLQPKEADAALKELRLGVDRQTFLPAAARITDVSEAETSFVLNNVKTRRPSEFQGSDFRFVVPEGVDVITRE